jgi:hypothetical protein
MQASQAALADHTLYCGTKGALDMITKYHTVSYYLYSCLASQWTWSSEWFFGYFKSKWVAFLAQYLKLDSKLAIRCK